jgi:hypothetical protein
MMFIDMGCLRTLAEVRRRADPKRLERPLFFGHSGSAAALNLQRHQAICRMPGKSQEPGSVRVAKAQHLPRSSLEAGRLSTIREVLERIGDYAGQSGDRSRAAALARAGVDGPDFYRALKANTPLSVRDATAVAGIADNPYLQVQWAQELQQAFLWHRATRLHVPLYDLSPLALLNGAATRHKRINTPKDYWLFLLFCVMQACGKEPATVNAANVGALVETLVDEPRRRLGEPVALTHAMILAYACLYNLPEDRRSAAAAMTAAVVAFDLAAQMNDVFIQGRMIQILERHVRPLLSGDAERAFCDCAVKAWVATAIRHQKTFRMGSRAALDSHAFTCEALQTARLARRHLGFAADHPRLRQQLTGAGFQSVQTALSAGLPHRNVDEFIKVHDELGASLLALDPGFEGLETVPAPGASKNVYRLDMFAELWLHRPGRERTLAGPPGRDWRFDPDQALAATSQAMAVVDPADATANTAIASVYTLHTEALLCRHARDSSGRRSAQRWTGSAQEEYRLARARAVDAFTALNMGWKLRRLAVLELRAGIDARQWGMRVLHRTSPNAAAWT